MRNFTLLIALSTLTLVLAPVLPARALEVQRLRPAGGAEILFRQSGMLVMRDSSGHFLRLQLAGGTLRIFRLTDGAFRQLHAVRGFSNHAMGRRLLGLSAVFDSDGDGVDEILIPDARRRVIKLVGFRNGKYNEREVTVVRHGFASDFHKLSPGRSGAAVVFSLSNGDVVIVSR